VAGLIALGLPVHAEGRDYEYAFLRNCRQPKLFVSGNRDPYGPVTKVEAAVSLAVEPKELVWIADADHFFSPVPGDAQTARQERVGSKLEEMQSALRTWAQQQFPALASP
jgi:hypothetical protein